MRWTAQKSSAPSSGTCTKEVHQRSPVTKHEHKNYQNYGPHMPSVPPIDTCIEHRLAHQYLILTYIEQSTSVPPLTSLLNVTPAPPTDTCTEQHTDHQRPGIFFVSLWNMRESVWYCQNKAMGVKEVGAYLVTACWERGRNIFSNLLLFWT